MLKTSTLSEAWSGVNWADLMAAQGAFGTDFYDRSTETIVGTMLWTEYRPVLKSVPKAPWAAMRSAQFTPLQTSDRVGDFARSINYYYYYLTDEMWIDPTTFAIKVPREEVALESNRWSGWVTQCADKGIPHSTRSSVERYFRCRYLSAPPQLHPKQLQIQKRLLSHSNPTLPLIVR